MLKRTVQFSLSLTAFALIAVTSSNIANSQVGGVKNVVWAQAATPGVSQTGHSNISGTSRAGSFIGNGAGLAGLNASNITAGTLSDGRLTTNVALRSASNNFLQANTFAGFVGIGTTTQTNPFSQFEIYNSGSLGGAVNLLITSANTNFDPVFRLKSGASAVDLTLDGDSDTLTLFNEDSTLNVADTGLFMFNTLNTQFSSNFIMESVNASGYGGLVARSRDNLTGRPFLGYATTGGLYSWTYLDAETNEWRVFHSDDNLRISSAGNFGINEAPASSASAEFVLSVPLSAGTVKNGIHATVNGTSVPVALRGTLATTATGGSGVTGEEFSTSLSAFAVYGLGNMGCSGVKPFQIDHPKDPQNKYLRHYSAESPEPQNFYNGTVRTDADGVAWIQLPDYFADINTNFRYQLTVVDSEDFAMVRVSREIEGNRFQIKSNRPNVKVCWQVNADRNDRYVQMDGAPTELDKPEALKGTYQYPEHWGQDVTKSEQYRRNQIAMQESAIQDRQRRKPNYAAIQRQK